MMYFVFFSIIYKNLFIKIFTKSKFTRYEKTKPSGFTNVKATGVRNYILFKFLFKHFFYNVYYI